MQPAAHESESTWYTRPGFRRTALAIVFVAIAVQAYYSVFRRDGDVLCHINYGRHFLQGEPYLNPGNYYSLGRVMFNVLFTLGEYHVVRAAFYCLAILALCWTFRIWTRMA